jgi:uncharacterized protein (DUF2147 family)
LPPAAPFDESFLEFLPTFFTDLSRFTWAHLWFVAYLLTFTLLYLPLFRWFRRLAFRTPHSAFRTGWWVYAPIVPLAIVQVTMRERWPGLQNLVDDWANFAYYSAYFIAGFLLARVPALEEAVHRERTRALAIGVAAALVLLCGVLGAFSSPAVMLAHTAVAGWCFVVALLGWAHRKLSFSTPALGFLSESAFPVYLLHQSAIVLPGYFLIRLPLGLGVKFLLLLVVASALTLAVYQWLVRPFALARFLCGMKTRTGVALRLAATMTVVALAVAASPWAAASSPVALAPDASPIGRWYAEGGAAQVEIRQCGAALCGRVVWLRAPLDENGCNLHDRYNPDPRLRNRPVIGLEVLRDLQGSADDDTTWSGGTIYDPASGNTYRCSLQLETENRLRLRGYLGIPLIGRTTTWIRVGAEQQLCRQSQD